MSLQCGLQDIDEPCQCERCWKNHRRPWGRELSTIQQGNYKTEANIAWEVEKRARLDRFIQEEHDR